MDSFISPLLEKNNKQIDKGANKGAHNIQSRVMKVMNPLSNLWVIIENLRSASKESHSVDNVDIYRDINFNNANCNPAKLHFGLMQMSQINGLLENQHYEALIPISVEVNTKISWWINQLELSNRESIISPNPFMILTSDASDGSLGPHWNRYWSSIEQTYHINAKEILAAFNLSQKKKEIFKV